MVHILSNTNSIVNQYISEIRDAEIQRDSLRFRRNIQRLGSIFAYEISREMKYEMKEVTTPLGIANVPVLAEQPVLATILRAGLPFHQGFLDIFDKADNAFVTMLRRPHKDHTFSMNIEYSAAPEINSRVLIMADVMLATGSSVLYSYRELLTRGKPSVTHIAAVLASSEGIDHLRKNLPDEGIEIWVGVVDDELTAQAYIVPGLGDAGDLCYGKKY
jgi:uracil phosphoribosyltransferase